MTGMIVLSKLNIAAGWAVSAGMAFAVALLLDTYDLILLAYIMLLLNVISGYFMMWKHRKGWDKEKWFKTCMKLAWFPLVIMATAAMERVYEIGVPLSAVVAAFITIHDLRSLLVNAGELTGLDLLNAINSIDFKNFRKKP